MEFPSQQASQRAEPPQSACTGALRDPASGTTRNRRLSGIDPWLPPPQLQTLCACCESASLSDRRHTHKANASLLHRVACNTGATEAASDARLNNFIGAVVANNAAQSGSLYDALRRQRIQQVGDTTQQITRSNDANLAYVKQQIAASNSG